MDRSAKGPDIDIESGVVDVPAKPHGFPLDARKVAVVVVDMQNDFATAGGMFDRAGIHWTRPDGTV